MAKYLLRTEEVYRVDSESEAQELIEEAKQDAYTLTKYNCEYHERKAKGEVVDSWYRVSLKRTFSEEKEPAGYTYITYTD